MVCTFAILLQQILIYQRFVEELRILFCKLLPYRVLGDPMYGWKALRLLARRSPFFFQMFGGAPISPLQMYLEYVIKKNKVKREPAPCSQEDPQTVRIIFYLVPY